MNIWQIQQDLLAIFDELEETLEKDRQDIGNIFNDIVKMIPA